MEENRGEYRSEKDELLKYAKMERKEHSWLTLEQAKRIASDHLAKDAGYYEEEEDEEEDDEEVKKGD